MQSAGKALSGQVVSYMISCMLPIDRPGKIVAVHLSYRSRAAERHVVPAWPSYFLKPPSSLAGSGDPVERPPGCELLAFEGEVALVIGKRATRVPKAAAWEHVAAITAANDLGVYDLRYADKGSNVRSKGIDGFTPLGPILIDARSADPADVRLRTWVNDVLVQDALSGKDLLFGFAEIVADLSRLLTLEPGDVILTGTPAGSTVVGPGDTVEVEVTAGERSSGRLLSPIAEAAYRLEPPGAMPRADPAQRAAAYGLGEAAQPGDNDVLTALREVATATLAAQLRKRGLNGCALDGLRGTRQGRRMAGYARTVRYLPVREDLFQARGGGMNAQKRAVEAVRPGEVLVIEARGDTTAGTIGDILALRTQVLGAAGIVTDGAIRDSEALAALSIPVYSAAAHPAVLGRRHVPWETDVTVACAGATIQPGDIIVGDADGVVVIPPAIAAELAADAKEQERQERFVAAQVAAGASIDGLYPIGDGWRARYEQWEGE